MGADREVRECAATRGVAANGNGGPEARIESAVLTLARLLGRRIAREDFRRHAANDNTPVDEASEN